MPTKYKLNLHAWDSSQEGWGSVTDKYCLTTKWRFHISKIWVAQLLGQLFYGWKNRGVSLTVTQSLTWEIEH